MPDQNSLAQRAETLLALHQPGDPVVLPTVWDAWSARLAVDAGFAALTVGSHPVADSVGKPDGEGMSFEDLLARVEQITAAVDVPVSVDVESGYGQSGRRLVDGLLVRAPSASTSKTPCTARASDCGPRPSMPSWWPRCGRRPTLPGCTW